MKIKFEFVDSDKDEEIVIKCNHSDIDKDTVDRIEKAVRSILKNDKMLFTLGNNQYYIHQSDILFFDTYDNKVTCHTVDGMYYTQHKLFELENILPNNFTRVSKSCILNINKISSIQKNPMGASKVCFYNTIKVVYISRSYFKSLKDKLNELF